MTRPLLALCALALVVLACKIEPVLPVLTPTPAATQTALIWTTTPCASETPQPVATGAGRVPTPGPQQ